MEKNGHGRTIFICVCETVFVSGFVSLCVCLCVCVSLSVCVCVSVCF